jgi:hypothetical protein
MPCQTWILLLLLGMGVRQQILKPWQPWQQLLQLQDSPSLKGLSL